MIRSYSNMHRKDKNTQQKSIVWTVCLNGCVFVYDLRGCGSALKKEFLDIYVIIKCGFTLKCVRSMIRTYRQMHITDKYSKQRSIILRIRLSGWVFDYELSGCGFWCSCSHLSFRFGACLDQGVLWHSGSYRLLIHSEKSTWHDKNIHFLFSIAFII